MVDEVSSATQTQTQSGAAKTTLASDFDAFLLLLTTQLKHQDPLSPIEPTEFTNQLVQFASVEQQIATNSNLENLLLIQNASLASAVVGFIGTEVEAQTNRVPLQDGNASFTYTLANNAKNTAIIITDGSGTVVKTDTGELGAGSHEYVWDGTDNDGNPVDDGPYSVSVAAVGVEGEQISTSMVMKGRVSGVSMNGNATTLDVGGVNVGLDEILSISEPTTSSGNEETPAT